MCPPGYHHNGFVECNKLSMEHNINCIFEIAHLASLGFEHFVCLGLLMTSYIMLLGISLFIIFMYMFIYI